MIDPVQVNVEYGARGSVADTLLANNLDLNSLRMFRGNDGRTYQSVNNGGNPGVQVVANAEATLRKNEWELLDGAIIRAAREELRVWNDLMSGGLRQSIPNGMAKSIYQYETMSDSQGAQMSMDGLAEAENFRPQYELRGLPLPIIHCDFSISLRQLEQSRNGSTPIDTTNAEQCGRRIAEEVEKLTLGVRDAYSFNQQSVYGYTNFPERLTGDITLPSEGGWEPATTVNEVLDMRQQAKSANHNGPYVLYHGSGWDVALDEDYSAAKGSNTLRERLMKIDRITDIRSADFMPENDMVLVQMTSNVVRGVVGQDIITLQWDSDGGLKKNFKVLAILVPQLRSDHYGNTGIVHRSPV